MNHSLATSVAAESPALKWLPASAAAMCIAVAAALALHHPLSPLVVVAACAVIALCAFRWPLESLAALLGAVPVVALAPWSGWLTFEETDLLALAVAAGGYARIAVHPARENRRTSASPLVWLALLAFNASVAVSAWRGVVDAGGFHFGWFHGYHEPMNSARLAKSFLLALLVTPLWLWAQRLSPALASRRLIQGMCLGLAAVSLAVLWERLAYTGLLNFSTDYRTTALFWEMHVGGAALDGYLALTVPFAVLALRQASTPWRIAAALAVLLVGAYACLSSFSRGVYAAVPLGVLLTLWQAERAESPAKHAAAATAGVREWLAACALVLAFASAAAWMFESSGYRGMLALLGAFVVLLRLPPIEASSARQLAATLLWSLALASAAMAVARWVPKGAYLAYATACIAALALSVRPQQRQRLLLATYVSIVVGIGLVARHWGGEVALARAWPIMALLAAAGLVRIFVQRPLWPNTLRWQAGIGASLVVTGAIVAVLGGGAYMSERFSTSSEDFSGRLSHWHEGLALLDTPADWAFGKGLGRYPSNHLLAHSGSDAPGDYRLRGEPPAQHLVLTGGKLPQGWGELLRVSQRVAPVGAGATVSFKVRAEQSQRLHLEVCEKHLLYNGRCLLHEVKIEPTGGEWRALQASLQGAGTSRGAWYAPRLISFSMANATSGALVEVDELALRDAEGRDLLANGDFSEGLAHWFFSSDRNHMPWHLKNIAVHTLFDQGVLGLALLVALVAGALWRTMFGSARRHPVAPAIAGALLGFLIVGMFDSLLDVPRVAFLFYLLVVLALTLRTPREVPHGAVR